MMLEDSSSDEHSQAVRRVYESDDLSNTTVSLSKVFRLACHCDDVSGKNIILWDDILAAFKEVVHVRAGENILPFLKGRDFKNLDPLRIAAVPGVTLDVIVTGQLVRSESASLQEAQTKTTPKELSLESLQNSLPNTLQEHSGVSSNSLATNIIRRNPAYGLVEEAWENYTHIVSPATALDSQGPQMTPKDKSPVKDNDDDEDNSKAQYSANKAQQSARAPQENDSITTQDFAETLMKAALGDKDAKVIVGDMYKDGRGVDRDYQSAMHWYLKAAEQKDPVGQSKVGYLYEKGLGVTQSYSTAMEWYLLAAEQGNITAQRNVGFIYRSGHGVPQDYSKAMAWYRKAADQGNVAAHRNIGVLYQYGLGVPQDYGKAMEWLRKAADQGHPHAQRSVGYLYDRGLGVPQDNAQAVEWYRKAAEQGLTVAQYNLGSMYEEGQGIGRDNAKSTG